ncbi:MAG: hypothetical protein RIS64_3678 [Bacteroidota bacterium]|jgi:transcriptional regulator with XRE-family HTH domain
MIKAALCKALINTDLSLVYAKENCGISVQQLCEYKRGKRPVSLERALTVAIAFGLHESFIENLNALLKQKVLDEGFHI